MLADEPCIVFGQSRDVLEGSRENQDLIHRLLAGAAPPWPAPRGEPPRPLPPREGDGSPRRLPDPPGGSATPPRGCNRRRQLSCCPPYRPETAPAGVPR